MGEEEEDDIELTLRQVKHKAVLNDWERSGKRRLHLSFLVYFLLLELLNSVQVPRLNNSNVMILLSKMM